MSSAALPALQRSVARLLWRLRWRAVAVALIVGAPLAAGVAMLGARLASPAAAVGASAGASASASAGALVRQSAPALIEDSAGLLAALLGLIALLAAVRSHRRHTAAWLARQLDALFPALQDSTALALRQASPARGLEALQRARARKALAQVLAALLGELPAEGPTLRGGPAAQALRRLRPAVPRRLAAAAWLAGAALIGLALAWPALRGRFAAAAAGPAAGEAVSAAATVLREATLTFTPPAYTGLAPQTLPSLDAKVPADSDLAWALVLDRPTQAVALAFDDGIALPLRRDGNAWRGQRRVGASTLYRVRISGAPALAGDPLHRIDALPDQPPVVTVREPEKTLNLLTEGQKTWSLAFEASDDYGLGTAELSIALAQGSGEQIKVTEQKRVLDGGSDPRRRSYRLTLDLAGLHFARGDDLIVRLTVQDNHTPQPQRSSSANFILRWPAEPATESLGLEGLVQKTLPAYFRSERQIIIDTEALIAERPTLAPAAFAARADALGVDQKVLRLRYGQFLGESFEGNAEHAPPGLEAAPAGPGASRGDAAADADARARAALKTAPPEPGAPGAAPPPPQGVGHEGNVLAEFGHVHDQAEAATLLDPQTKRVLKVALDAMWQAELKLRQALPDDALPFEYRALDAIKQVQQAERIYLARAGQALPTVDDTRRLSGDRKGLTDRDPPLPPAAPPDSPAPALWAALAGVEGSDHGARADLPDLAPMAAWLRQHPQALPDPLGWIAAADRLTQNPGCAECREALKSRLWPLLPQPPTAVRGRTAPDAAGRAYLEALTGVPGSPTAAPPGAQTAAQTAASSSPSKTASPPSARP